jgi:hypothetical protein
MNQYNVYSLTEDQLRELIRFGDDSKKNQIRIKRDGTIFLSNIVGADNLGDIIGRFETFQPGNNYVGSKAASDDRYIKRLFLTIKHWIDYPQSFIDIWVNV